MEQVAQQIVNGLTIGSLYALIAVGYTVVYGIIQLINFAHGEIFMIGAFGALSTSLILFPGTTALWTLPLILIGAIAASVTVAVVMERVAYRPLRNAPRLAPLITAIGMSIVLSNFIQVTQGPRNKPIPRPATFGKGSTQSTTTRGMPERRIKSAQGGVLPWCEQGSRVT